MAVGIAASFASTLASQALIRLVERDRALWPYAAYRAGLAAVVLAKLRRAVAVGYPAAVVPRFRTRLVPERRPSWIAPASAERIARVERDAYAKAGVDQGAADSAVAGAGRGRWARSSSAGPRRRCRCRATTRA